MFRHFIGFLLSAVVVCAAPNRSPLAQPNLVILMADDLGWGDLGIHGNPQVATPNLDELAKSGARLDRFYVCPASAPTTSSLLTGRHCLLTGVIGDSQGTHILHQNEITFAEVLQEDGYQTGYFGRWQNGVNPPHDAGSQGFGQVGEVNDGPAFMEANAEWPFCAFIALPALDHGDHIPEEAIEKHRERGLGAELATVYAGIEVVDSVVGNIVNQLKILDLESHTMIVLLSDCGPKDIEGRFNSGLYGSQGSLHEGGLRVPSIWRWKGVIPERAVVHHICHHTDLFPTVLGFAGSPVPDDRTINGLNIAPLLLFGDDARWPNRNLGSVWIPGRDLANARRSYRTTRWAAILDPKWRRDEIGADDERWELYDLKADPRQHYNVAEAYPFVLAGLKSDIAHWFHKSQVFGYPVIPWVLDAKPIQLDPCSAVFPSEWPHSTNLGFIEGWDRAGFSASWPIEASRTGRVRGEIVYRFQGAHGVLLQGFGDENSTRLELGPSTEWQRAEFVTRLENPGAATYRIVCEAPLETLEVREVLLQLIE
tara:strand:- start:34835 stop:36451 length:1617 start_codon:yes stop_codon:yes gene_type:complete